MTSPRNASRNGHTARNGLCPNQPAQSLRQTPCAACKRIFHVCRRHDRGQQYCSTACRTRARQRVCRSARARYQATEDGRRDHRDRQRAYRRRKAELKSVTDLGSQTDKAPDMLHPSGTDLVSAPSAVPPATPSISRTYAASSPKCISCGRVSYWVHFDRAARSCWHNQSPRPRLRGSRHFSAETRGR